MRVIKKIIYEKLQNMEIIIIQVLLKKDIKAY